jgi:hypothetical protein
MNDVEHLLMCLGGRGRDDQEKALRTPYKPSQRVLEVSWVGTHRRKGSARTLAYAGIAIRADARIRTGSPSLRGICTLDG